MDSRRDPCAASTRVTGLGALNRFFVLYGLFLAILNVLPISLDCRQSMQSWLGVPHECTEVENFLNLMWCIALLGFGLMTAGVAALPKLTQYTSPSPGYPQKINQLAMQVLAICHLIVLSWMLVASLTMTVHVDGTVAETLSDQDWAQVEFELPLPGYKGAELLFYVNADTSTQDKPMRLEVNGQRFHACDLFRYRTQLRVKHPILER